MIRSFFSFSPSRPHLLALVAARLGEGRAQGWPWPYYRLFLLGGAMEMMMLLNGYDDEDQGNSVRACRGK